MKPLSLRRRKVRAMRIFKQPIFRRSLPTPKVAQEALEFIKERFASHQEFENLTQSMHIEKSSESVRTLKFKGTEFAVKDTEGSFYQGHSKKSVKENEVRHFVKLHHAFFRKRGLREKVTYILRTPKLFGVAGNYLLLEKVKKWIPQTKEEILTVQKAYRDLSHSFTVVSALNKNLQQPQLRHVIPAGIYKGKVVFYTVYDYL